MSRSKLNCLNLIALLVIMHCLTASSASGAPAQPQNNAWGAKNGHNGFTGQQLKEQPELPQLPTYSGKCKFLNGFVQTNEEGWVVYSINYLTKEAPEAVCTWYRNAFNMYQWTTLHAGGPTITADQKNGNMCSIMVNATREPGYRSKLEISYSIAPQDSAIKEGSQD
jgi:hypothetical protein